MCDPETIGGGRSAWKRGTPAFMELKNWRGLLNDRRVQAAARKLSGRVRSGTLLVEWHPCANLRHNMQGQTFRNGLASSGLHIEKGGGVQSSRPEGNKGWAIALSHKVERTSHPDHRVKELFADRRNWKRW